MRNVMAHAQKPDFVFPRNGRVHLNRWGRQFSRLLVAEVGASAWVMLDRPRSEVATEYWLPTPFASFPLHSPPTPSRASPCTIRFRTSSTKNNVLVLTFFFPSKEIMQTYHFTTLCVNQMWKHYIDNYEICTNICHWGQSEIRTRQFPPISSTIMANIRNCDVRRWPFEFSSVNLQRSSFIRTRGNPV